MGVVTAVAGPRGLAEIPKDFGGTTVRLGKKERARAKAVEAIVSANLANMRTLQQEQHLFGGHNRWTRSCANPDRLKAATKYGYRDNLHGKADRPISGSCRVDKK